MYLLIVLSCANGMIEAGHWDVEDTEYCKTNERHCFTGASMKGVKKNDNLKAVDLVQGNIMLADVFSR